MGLCIMHRQAVNEQGGYLWDPVPAGLPSPGDGVVHDVIRHQEECLQLQGTQSPVSCREKAEEATRCCAASLLGCNEWACNGRLAACCSCVSGLCMNMARKVLVACKPARGRLLKRRAHPLNAPAQNIGLKQLLTACLQRADDDAVSPSRCLR